MRAGKLVSYKITALKCGIYSSSMCRGGIILLSFNNIKPAVAIYRVFPTSLVLSDELMTKEPWLDPTLELDR